MRDERQDLARTARLRRSEQSGSRADQIVDDKGCGTFHVCNEKFARDNASAAVLVRKGFADRKFERFLERFAEKLSDEIARLSLRDSGAKRA